MADDELSPAQALEHEEYRLRVYDALALMAADPRAVFDVVVDAADPMSAVDALRDRFGLDELQATAVLEAQFRRATALDRQKILDSRRDLAEHVAELRSEPPQR